MTWAAFCLAPQEVASVEVPEAGDEGPAGEGFAIASLGRPSSRTVRRQISILSGDGADPAALMTAAWILWRYSSPSSMIRRALPEPGLVPGR